MVQPIDYTVPMQNPLAAFEQAANMGMGIRQNQQTLEANRLKIEAEKVAQARQAEIQARLAKLSEPGATADDYANISMLLPKDQAESVRSAYSMKDKAANETALRDSSQVFTAFNAGKPEIAMKLMSDKITALRNSGKEQEAAYLENWLEVAKDDPDAAKNFFGFTISQMPGGKDVLQSAIDYSKAPAEVAKGKSAAEREASLATTAAAEAALAPERAKAELGQVNANIRRINAQIANDAKRLQADIANANRTFELESKKAGVTGAPKLTEAQAKDMLNAQRLARAGKVTADLELAGYNPTMSISDTKARQYKAAKREFADAVLRSTTGAAATKDEIANAEKMYFPEFGDGPDVRLQKSEMRAAFVQDMFSRAGPGMAGKQAPSMKTQAPAPSQGRTAAGGKVDTSNPLLR